ncbi:MAG: hypothetical protein ACXWQR_05270 [Ktedonobacterales bacterium]
MPGYGAAPPERPAVPDDIGAQVAAAERRRAWGVQVCIAVGACLAGVGIYLYSRGGRVGWSYVAALALLGMGLIVGCLGGAAAAWFLGPTWEQRQQHWRLLRWEREYEEWKARERTRCYVKSLDSQT